MNPKIQDDRPKKQVNTKQNLGIFLFHNQLITLVLDFLIILLIFFDLKVLTQSMQVNENLPRRQVFQPLQKEKL